MSDVRDPTPTNAGPGELRHDEPMPSVGRSEGRRWRCETCDWSEIGAYVAMRHAHDTGHTIAPAGRLRPRT